jgi:hypothetical protein
MYFVGIPFVVRGQATTATGDAHIRVWLDYTPVPGVTIPLAQCEATAPATATCNAEVGVGQTYESNQLLSVVTCHVEGRTSGWYNCRTGSGF